METLKAETNQRAGDANDVSLQRQVAALAEAVQKLQAQLADQARVLGELTARLAGAAAQAPPLEQAADAEPSAEISAEILVIIAAAVTGFLGKKVKIRSAKMLQSPYEIVNPWAQQGRVIVQASHFLRRS